MSDLRTVYAADLRKCYEQKYIDAIDHKDCAEIADILDAQAARIAELEAVVEKLPKTADGVRYDQLQGSPPFSEPTAFYWHGGRVYEVRDWKYNWERVLLGVVQGVASVKPFGYLAPTLSECYSTRAAAEAAKGGG